MINCTFRVTIVSSRSRPELSSGTAAVLQVQKHLPDVMFKLFRDTQLSEQRHDDVKQTILFRSTLSIRRYMLLTNLVVTLLSLPCKCPRAHPVVSPFDVLICREMGMASRSLTSWTC